MIIRRDADGASHVTETTDVTPTQAGVGAGVWGLLLGTLFGGPIGGLVVGAATAGGGALYAKLRDTGVQDETIDEAAQAVPPGRTAVALLVSHVSVGRPAARADPLPARRAGRDRHAAGRGQRGSGGAARGEPRAVHRLSRAGPARCSDHRSRCRASAPPSTTP